MYVMTGTNMCGRDYLSYFPQILRGILMNTPEENLCEIRLLKSHPIVLKYSHGRFYSDRSGILTKNRKDAYIPANGEFLKLLERLVDFSVYAHEEELKNAYVTVKGGHRIGLAGEIKGGRIRNLSDITSINFRIAHEHIGIAQNILSGVLADGRVKNTIIISPPMCGKTSLLRDLIRLLGENLIKVGVCDTRGEIAAVYDGRPYMDIGDADVITGTSKAIGMMMLLRCMSPEVIACDELGSREDYKAIEAIMHSGVSVVATAHANNREGLIKTLEDKGFREKFDTVITLCGTGIIKEVYHG